MLTVLTANGPSGYSIANSLRFRSSASAYLNRTLTTPANAYKWTWSGWLKRGVFADVPFFSGYNTGALTRTFISFSSDTILFYQASGSGGSITYPVRFFTTPVYRDPSAWYHIILSYDSTQATSTNRVSFYVNGVQVTNFSVADYPSQNYACDINAATTHTICRDGYNNTNGFDGYLTEINFVDGQALTPSSFGEIDSTTGVWKAKRYTGTYGTNGFRLNFSNGTSTTTLGYDSSGNGNNWTTNNISLTAGSTYDWMIDSPTPYPGSSYGVGNYCTFNPLFKLGGTAAGTWARNGNLEAKSDTASSLVVFGTIGLSNAKFYTEFTMANVVEVNDHVGIVTDIQAAADGGTCIAYKATGDKIVNGSVSAYGASYTDGDVIGVAVNLINNEVIFYKNGVSQGTITSVTVGVYFHRVRFNNASGQQAECIANWGQRSFAYTPPSGFKSLCTQNLSTPSIVNGAQYMAATTYTGTGSSVAVNNAVNNVSFAPDMIWTKSRSASGFNIVQDSVRGAGNRLITDGTFAELYDVNYGTFASNGFNIGSNNNINTNGTTYVAWQWKAGGTAVTNTAGSISSQVSANTTAGFSVVTYTGTGSAATTGHGLGVAPNMIFVKRRDSADTWNVYHSSLGANQWLELNTTAASQTATGVWNNTAPTSNVFSLGFYFSVNASGSTYVAYCFAAIPGYSAFGSYTGNGSTDGPFVYLGFRPRYVMIKRTDSAANWIVIDTSTNPYNVATNYLMPNLSTTEGSDNVFDIVSNGLKFRLSSSVQNATGGTYIYAAFAENPFQNALAR